MIFVFKYLQKHISCIHPTRNGVLAFLQDYKKTSAVTMERETLKSGQEDHGCRRKDRHEG